jgi:hypothetical protein
MFAGRDGNDAWRHFQPPQAIIGTIDWSVHRSQTTFKNLNRPWAKTSRRSDRPPAEDRHRGGEQRCDVGGLAILIGAYVCDAARTPFGRFAGALAALRNDDPTAQDQTSTLPPIRRARRPFRPI